MVTSWLGVTFTSASHAGHLMAIYNLALMHLTGLGIPVSCPTALALLKSVAERGQWSQVLQHAHAAFLKVRRQHPRAPQQPALHTRADGTHDQ